MLTGQALENNNDRYYAACKEARDWVAAQLVIKGCATTVGEHSIITVKQDGSNEGSAVIEIVPNFRQFSREAIGFTIRVKRRKHPITYRREGLDWKVFDWKKILAVHVKEVDDSLAYETSRRKEWDLRTRLGKQAQEEVWLPQDEFGRGAIHTGYLTLNRQRKEDGTYDIHLTGGPFTAEEVRQIRDITIAAHNRTAKEPITLPKSTK